MYLRGGTRGVKVAQFKVAKLYYLLASVAECCRRKKLEPRTRLL